MATMPKQNADFWKEKFEHNIQRDRQKVHDLEVLGWRVITVWECETKRTEELTNRLMTLLKAPS
jgi:DNA mismatch endonuclease (patch repair protein)